MSTLWWIAVLALACAGCFTVGWIAHVEYLRYVRQVYDIDFTQRRVGL